LRHAGSRAGINVARVGVLLAGFPDTIPAVTVNRFCSSGVQSIAMAADRIRVGDADLIIAGGTESMSMIPMMGHKVATNPAIFNDENIGIAYGMGITAEKVAERFHISREAQDAMALRSHQRALQATRDGKFRDEIAPYEITHKQPDPTNGEVLVSHIEATHDECPRPDTSAEGLAKLRPVFRNKGSVTAGNSSQMSDGAGAVLVASEAAIKRFDLTPMGRFVSFAVAGVAPEVMGIGPIAAIPKACEKAGISIADLDWIELNEAFAAQAQAVINELELDPEKVNPLGGAIALGHALGATGAVRTATALHGIRRDQSKYAMVTMCIGTGMGAAGIYERV